MLWTIVKTIWNGPFHVGPLTRPVSVGDVFLKVLETVWRSFIVLLSLALVVTGAIVIWTFVLQPTFFPPLAKKIKATAVYGVNPPPPMLVTTPITSGKAEAAAAQAELKIQAEYDGYYCSSDYPILIEFQNTSSKSVKIINFDIEAHNAGRSDNVAGYNYLTSDTIIPSGKSTKSCWNVPYRVSVKADSLIYQVHVLSAE